MRYLYESHIFNTSLEGEYNEYNIVSGHYITAQGVLLCNSLGNNLTSYVAKDADKATADPTTLQKMEAFSRIVHMNEYGNITYLVEAQGIQRLVNLADGHIDSSTFSGGDIATVKANRELILEIIETSYDVGSPYAGKRSGLASEFISGVLNTILENEYNKLDTNFPAYQYVTFSFGQDINDSVLTMDDYDSLNEVEYNGLDGMIDALDDISALGIMMTPSQRAHLVSSLSKMGPTPGVNSHIAQAMYLAEAHSKFKLLAGIPNARMEYFVPADETETDPTIDGNIYSNTFCFKDYSEDLNAYLS